MPLPMTANGNKYIVVVSDLFSKWVEAFPVKSTDTETLARVLVDEVICRYGTPLYLHSDQGANLTSKLMGSVCNLLGIKQTRTTPKEMARSNVLTALLRLCWLKLLVITN